MGNALAKRCFVKMIYVYDDSTEKSFTRTVISTGATERSEYRIDGNTVTPAQYQEHLEEINIFIKAKNFLVYQGTVEGIATKSAKELTEMFEKLSKLV